MAFVTERQDSVPAKRDTQANSVSTVNRKQSYYNNAYYKLTLILFFKKKREMKIY